LHRFANIVHLGSIIFPRKESDQESRLTHFAARTISVNLMLGAWD
jgi:hypothetical protein